MKKITVYLEDSTIEKMEQRAKKAGRTPSEEIREAVTTGVELSNILEKLENIERLAEKLQTIEDLLNEPVSV